MGAARQRLATALFLGMVGALGAGFVAASAVQASPDLVERLLRPPDVPFTVVTEPPDPREAPFTIATLTGPVASIALSLPGAVAGGRLLAAVEDAGLDPLGATAVRGTRTAVNADGTLSPYITVGLLTDEGYVDVLGVSSDGNALWYTPPVLQLPRDLAGGTTWTSEGLTLDFAPYTLSGTVVGPAVSTSLANIDAVVDECVDVRTTLKQEIPEAEGYTTERLTTWCPGLGAIASTNVTSGVTSQLARASDVDWPDPSDPLPPQSRLAGTRLPMSIPVSAVTLPPMSLPGGLVMVNSSLQDLALVTVGPEADSGVDDTSSLVWLQHPGGTVLGAGLSGDRILITSSLRSLQSFDTAGRLRWSTELPDVSAGAPVAVGNSVVVALVDGSLRGFAASTGEPQWVVRLADVITESPVLAGNLVVAADSSGSVVAVDGAGRERWSTSVDPVDSLSPLPDGSVLVGQTSGLLTVVEQSGEERWSASLSDSGVVSPATQWADVMVVPTDGGIRGLAAESGRELWRLTGLTLAKVAPNGLVSTPDRIVQVTTEGRIADVIDMAESSGPGAASAYLTLLGDEWVAVSSDGSITYTGVRHA